MPDTSLSQYLQVNLAGFTRLGSKVVSTSRCLDSGWETQAVFGHPRPGKFFIETKEAASNEIFLKTPFEDSKTTTGLHPLKNEAKSFKKLSCSK